MNRRHKILDKFIPECMRIFLSNFRSGSAARSNLGFAKFFVNDAALTVAAVVWEHTINTKYGIIFREASRMENKLKIKALLRVLLTIGLLIVSVPIFAHHGTNISYDRSKPVTLKGVVTEFRFANPHPQLYVDVKDSTGKVTNWGCEIAANPYQLILSGWTKRRSMNELKPGTIVTITIAPSRAGTNAALLIKVVNEKGQELLAAGADNQQ